MGDDVTSLLFPFEFPLVFDDAYDVALEQLINRLTAPHYTEDDGDTYKLMQMQALQVEKQSHTIDDITAAHKLKDATGYSLDQFGVMVKLLRETGEGNDHYRARLYTQIAIYMRSATPQDMVSTCAGVLGVGTDRVVFTDGSLPASFGIAMFLLDITNAGISFSDLEDMIDAAKAGGVDMTINTIGTFTCRGIGDASDNTKGYNNLANDNPDGGRYGGMI